MFNIIYAIKFGDTKVAVYLKLLSDLIAENLEKPFHGLTLSRKLFVKHLEHAEVSQGKSFVYVPELISPSAQRCKSPE